MRRPGATPPPNITAIGRAVSLSGSSRSDWNVCAGSWRTASRWSAFMTPSRKPWNEGLITAAMLQTKQFRPVRIILPDLIPEGVTILAGKPKIGKSWLALDVCMAVADENRFVLGSIRPVHGDALYLALEDNERRLHRRIDKIMQGQARWPERLAMHIEWRRFDRGGLDDIEEWCR